MNETTAILLLSDKIWDKIDTYNVYVEQLVMHHHHLMQFTAGVFRFPDDVCVVMRRRGYRFAFCFVINTTDFKRCFWWESPEYKLVDASMLVQLQLSTSDDVAYT